MRSGNSSSIGNRQNFGSTNNGRDELNVNTGLLRFYSVISIMMYSVCVGLEAFQPYVGQGIWGSGVYLVSGLLGFGASYRPTYTRLTWVLSFSCMSILFGLIVSGLSWAGYTDCDHYYAENDSDEIECNRPASQLALMIINIFVIVISIFVMILVSRPLCCTNKSTTQNRHRVTRPTTARVATIETPTEEPVEAPNLSTGTRNISTTGIHIFSTHRPEMEILSRLALFSRRPEEEEERPPRYSIVVAESSDVDTIYLNTSNDINALNV